MTKHYVLLGLAVVLFVVTAATAVADDLLPPDWRGGDNSTLQIWEFLTDDNPASPTVDQNPFGTAQATIYGEWEFPNRDTFWVSDDLGHEGVWYVGGSMSLEIPNDPAVRPMKMIRMQITYDGGYTTPEPQPWIVVEAPDGEEVGELELIQQISLDETYVHDTYDLVIEPNPSSEVIWIQPRYSQVYIDQIVVDTICLPDPAPEPSTLVSLLIGAVACAICPPRRR